MYNYKSLSKTTGGSSSLPSLAMTYDGDIIENVIDGYTTLKVGGRETTSVQLEESFAFVGGIVTRQTLPSRELTITYQLIAQTTNELQTKFKTLMKILYKSKDVQISFKDDTDTSFFGRFTNFDTIPDDRTKFVGSFIIHCSKPYKYGQLIETTGSVPIDTFYNTTPERIELTTATASNDIRITNGQYTIRYVDTVNAGSTMVFDFTGGEMNVYVNGVNQTYGLALNSDFENFLLTQNEPVTTNNGTLKLFMRERWL